MMKKLLLITFLTLFSTTLITAQNLPTNPDPGKCYVKCITKDVFDTVTESIQVQPSYQTLSVVPATYKTVEERVVVKEASKRLVVIPGFNYPAKLISFAVVNLWLFVLHVQQNLWFWRHI